MLNFVFVSGLRVQFIFTNIYWEQASQAEIHLNSISCFALHVDVTIKSLMGEECYLGS